MLKNGKNRTVLKDMGYNNKKKSLESRKQEKNRTE